MYPVNSVLFDLIAYGILRDPVFCNIIRTKFIQKNNPPHFVARLVISSYLRSHILCLNAYKLTLAIVSISSDNETSQSIGLLLPNSFSKTIFQGT